MILEKLTLLSRDEFKQYQFLITEITKWWWLRTALAEHESCVHTVDNCGELYINGCGCCSGGVRPLAVVSPELSDTMFWHKPANIIGTSIKYGNYTWTVLYIKNGEIYALCDVLIEKHRFDSDTNDWDKSELKVWLETIGLTRITS